MKVVGTLLGSIVTATVLVTSAYASPVSSRAGDASRTAHIIPFTFNKGMVEVEAYINGKKVNALLDSGTGGPGIIINSKILGALGLSSGGSSIQSGIGGQGVQKLIRLHINTIQFGPIHLSNVPALATNISYVTSAIGPKIYAYLGYAFFVGHVITVNYPKRTVSIYPKTKPLTCRNPIPISLKKAHVPIVTAKVKLAHSHRAQTLHLVVDLGSVHTAVVLGEKALTTNAAERIISSTLPTTGNNPGNKAKVWKATVAKLEVSGNSFRNVPAFLTKDVQAFNGHPANGSLGVALWKKGSITFDYPAKEICISTAHGQSRSSRSSAEGSL